MKRCVPQVSRIGTLLGQGGKRAFSPAAAEQIYPVFSPLNQEDFSQNASVACSCSSITRETEQSIKQGGSKIQDLMPRIYFSLPCKPTDTGQVLQHHCWLLGLETRTHRSMGTDNIHIPPCPVLPSIRCSCPQTPLAQGSLPLTHCEVVSFNQFLLPRSENSKVVTQRVECERENQPIDCEV